MDSTAKAGGALTACAEVHAPVVFIGTGEKAHELEHFNPESFLSRLLGMGDLKGLLEKSNQHQTKKKLEQTKKTWKKANSPSAIFKLQLETMGEVGSFDKILSMVPGMNKANIPQEAMEKQQSQAKRWKHAISSMTPEEIENPELLEKQTPRMARIAKARAQLSQTFVPSSSSTNSLKKCFTRAVLSQIPKAHSIKNTYENGKKSSARR